MRTALILLLSGLGSCAYSDRYPFHTVALLDDGTTLPPGVRVATYLDGVFEMPREGVPTRFFEMRIDIEQRVDVPQWRPTMEKVVLQDDEGRSFDGSWFVLDSDSLPEGMSRYRLVFELKQPYKFESIMQVTVRWDLASRDSPVFRVRSVFQK